MGMKIFVASGTFNPADFGLKIGDELNIICVGGGMGGSDSPGTASPVTPGGSGATSSFGNIVSAVGGSQTTGQFINIAKSNYLGLGGCGGFILGTNDWGGVAASLNPGTNTPSIPSPGSAGANNAVYAKNRYEGTSFGAGNGNVNNAGDISCGGGGYGAGGGCGNNYRSMTASYKDQVSGNSGKVEYATHKLIALDIIAVSVGGGGAGSRLSYKGGDGTITGGGKATDSQAGDGGYNNIKGKDGAQGGGGGAGGVVIVFW